MPDIASWITGLKYAREKPRDYAAMGIGEHRRSSETGRHQETRLTGKQLLASDYVAGGIEELHQANSQEYSPVLNLYRCFVGGEMQLPKSATGCGVATFILGQGRRLTPHFPIRCHHEARPETP